jgi:hypothetical protein
MIVFEKNLPDGIIGEAPLTDVPGGKVIGACKIEKLGSNLMAHVDAAEVPDALFSGFSFGHLSVYDDVPDPIMDPYDMVSEETMNKIREKLREGTSSTFDA